MANKTKKVLIVEDEVSLTKVLTEKLSAEGMQITTAKNGEDGLKLAEKEKPDLILLDIIMPRMDGITMLRKLRNFAWGKKIKVIILSNLSEAGHSISEEKLNVHDFLVKSDWKLEDLVKKVKEILK